MQQSGFLQQIVLQIPHHGVEFRHGIADRGSGGKDNALSAGDLIKIAALCEHIRGLLRVRLTNAGNIPHFCGEEQIFEQMSLIHKELIHAKFLKVNDIILTALVIQLFQTGLQRFSHPFQLLDGITLAVLTFRLVNALKDLVDLIVDDRLLPIR